MVMVVTLIMLLLNIQQLDLAGNCAGDSGIELRACNILTNQTAMVRKRVYQKIDGSS